MWQSEVVVTWIFVVVLIQHSPAARSVTVMLRSASDTASHTGASNTCSTTALMMTKKTSMLYFPVGTDECNIHERFMAVALNEAELAGREGEVPIGAAVVMEMGMGKPTNNELAKQLISKSEQTTWRMFYIAATGRNAVEAQQDASAHAEMIAMRRAASSIGNWRLLDATLYSTLEPCPMCLSAAQAFRVSKVVWAAPDIRLGAVCSYVRLLDVAKHPYHDNLQTVGGILQERSAELMKGFFRERRKKKQTSEKRRGTNNSTMSKLRGDHSHGLNQCDESCRGSKRNRKRCFSFERLFVPRIWKRQNVSSGE